MPSLSRFQMIFHVVPYPLYSCIYPAINLYTPLSSTPPLELSVVPNYDVI